MGLGLIFLICALICFAVKVLLGLFDGSSGKLDLLALGLTFLAASFLAR